MATASSQRHGHTGDCIPEQRAIDNVRVAPRVVATFVHLTQVLVVAPLLGRKCRFTNKHRASVLVPGRKNMKMDPIQAVLRLVFPA